MASDGLGNPYRDEFEVPERLLHDLANTPVVAEDDIDRFDIDSYAKAGDVLTVAEVEMLRYASRGLTERQVAAARGVSFETVHGHAKTVRYKLRAKNMTQACCEAIRRGLIP